MTTLLDDILITSRDSRLSFSFFESFGIMHEVGYVLRLDQVLVIYLIVTVV